LSQFESSSPRENDHARPFLVSTKNFEQFRDEGLADSDAASMPGGNWPTISIPAVSPFLTDFGAMEPISTAHALYCRFGLSPLQSF
jgi:hypothetical protein